MTKWHDQKMDPADIAVVFDELKEEFYIFSKIST